MDGTKLAEKPEKVFSTARPDTWWVEPTLVFIGFTIFIVYATWRAFEGEFYKIGPYLSPFYSPELLFNWWHWSPAILILWIPAGFRATCYYYRKAYYRSYFVTPPACGVQGWGMGSKYCGETKFPLIFQNLHRYFLYLAIVILGILWWDAIKATDFEGRLFTGCGVGTIVLFVNVYLLTGYTLGCHAFRHLVGGSLDCFSCPGGSPKPQFKFWKIVTKLNERHMLWAWLSLFSVGFADFYVRCVATGAIPDIRLF